MGRRRRGDGASSRTGRWRFGALLALACAANLVPIWSAETLPMGDLGGHLELMDVAARYDDPDTLYAQVFTPLDRAPLPNSLAIWTARGLRAWLGAETVCRLLVSFYAAGLGAGTWLLLRAFGRSPWLAFLAFPLSFNALMNVGLLNFLIALPLVLASVGLARRFAEHGGRGMAATLALLLALLFFAHVYACLIALALTLALLALFGRWRGLLVGAPAAALVAAWLYRMLVQAVATESGLRFVGAAGLEPVFLPWGTLVGQIPDWGMSYFRDRTDDVAFAVLAGLWLALLAMGLWRRGPGVALERPPSLTWLREHALELLTLCCAASYFVQPSHLHDVQILTERVVVLTLCLLVGWPRPDARSLAARVVLALGVGLALAYPFFVQREFRRFERTQVGDLRAAIAELPQRSRLASVTWDPWNPVTFMGPTWHLDKWFHSLENGGITDDSFAARSHMPIRYRPGQTPQGVSRDFLEHDEYLAWDHLLLRSRRRPDEALAEPTLRLRFHQGEWWLFDVDRPPLWHTRSPGVGAGE